MNWREEQEHWQKVIDSFPEQFGLSTFPGDGPFRIDPSTLVHFKDQLIVQVKNDGAWIDFSRGTEGEIRGYVTEWETKFTEEGIEYIQTLVTKEKGLLNEDLDNGEMEIEEHGDKMRVLVEIEAVLGRK